MVSKRVLKYMSCMLLVAGPGLVRGASEFTFQGHLKDNQIPFNGTVDMMFTLFDSSGGATPLAPPHPVNDVSVQNGLFSVELDFGAGVFDGTPRWLDIGLKVRPATTYTNLTPRSKITGAPFAHFAPGNSGGSTGSLDDAYDYGGPGAGKKITADSGPIHVAGPDGMVVSGGVTAGAGFVGHPDGLFDVESSRIGTFAPPTVGVRVKTGTIGALTDYWAYLSGGTTVHKLVRNTSSKLNFAVETDPIDGREVTQMTLDAQGKLGIGTSIPSAKLHVVNGTDTSPSGGGFAVFGSEGGSNISIDSNEIMAREDGSVSPLHLNLEGGDVSLIGNGAGNVGVGVTIPKQKLHVNGDYYGRGHLWLHAFEGDGQSGTAYIQARDDSSSSAVKMQFRTKVGSTIRDVMTLSAFGYVGINTTTPGRPLDVNGIARVEVLEITGGSDLSEGFDIQDEQAKPGMVVVIDPQNPGRLKCSSSPYDRKVAGVISGAGGVNTGMIMGQQGSLADGEHPVALTGRVFCYVDATKHAIEPGDLLTTSSTPGYAMKVSDYNRAAGSIVGKAMTGLSLGERGLVLVLVGLQ